MVCTLWWPARTWIPWRPRSWSSAPNWRLLQLPTVWRVCQIGSPRLGLPRTAWPELLWGDAARVQAVTAPEVDTVISAIVGVAGLEATYEAVRLGKRVGLANKEVLVSGGKLVMEAVRQHGALLVPIDSEHNGAHQCLRAGNRQEVTRLILTASGGPFRNTPQEALASVTPRAGAQSSDVEHGEPHHHRLRHPHEQGF